MAEASVKGGYAPSAIIAALGGVAAAGIFIASLTGHGDPAALRTWALVVLAISLFATHALPEHVTALIVMLLALVSGIAPTSVVFSGFEVGALWLLFSGIIIGVAAQEAGLGVYFARQILGRVRMTYIRAVVLLTVTAFLLGFVVPSTIPRIIILIPIALGLADAMGFKPGGRGYTGLAFAVGIGTFIPTIAIVTANLPAVVHVGAMEAIYGVKISYAEYLLYHFPVNGLFRAISLVVVLIVLFREPETVTEIPEHEAMTPTQKRLSLVLIGALIMWGTDVWHGIHPAWVAMGAAIVVLWPGTKLISPKAFKEKIDLSPMLYIAGILSIGAIMIQNGLDKDLSRVVLDVVDWHADDDFLNLYLISLLAAVICLVVTAPAAPVLLVPIAGEISLATGLSLTAVLMSEINGFATMLLPYQGPPMVVLLSLCVTRVSDLVKVNALMAVAMFTLGLPLTYVWWRFVGLF